MTREQFLRDIVGGLDTLSPAWAMAPNRSPDSQNVLTQDRRVRSRGGFVPLIREPLPGNSVRNVGWHTRSRTKSDIAGTEGDFLVVPGHLLAGHRPNYYAATAFTFDLFLEIDDLTSSAGGNSQPAGAGLWNGAPYDVKVRPILSKGPVHRTIDTVTVVAGGQGWDTAATHQWGRNTNDGCPFFLYLWNSGTGASPVWAFQLAAHVLVSGNWTLQIASSTVQPEVGGRYHIIGVVSGARVTLRIARLFGTETPSYTEVSTTFTGTLGNNQCCIQVFDCAQKLIEENSASSATVRPGLNLGGATQGGYWFAAARFEGKIEDLAIWSGDQLSGTNRDRRAKLDVTQASNLLGYWDMLATGTRVVKEQTGAGNHLYMAPWGPVFDPHSGGVGDASWWFNGQTSYAMPDLDRPGSSVLGNPSWRYLETGTNGAFQHAVRNNTGHGLQVRFWVDAIEPTFEQVIAEIQGVLRLVIATDGRIQGYCRATGAAPAYQGPVSSSFTVVPGKRYSITLWRVSGGLSLQLYDGGILDASLVVTANSGDATGMPVSGISIGMGCVEVMNNCASSNDLATMPGVNQINTDSRSGFVGRIEDVKIVGGTPIDTVGLEDLQDWTTNESRIFTADNANRNRLYPADPNDTPSTVVNTFVELAGTTVAGIEFRYLVTTAALAPSYYILSTNTLLAKTVADAYGHTGLNSMGIRIFTTLMHYRLNVDDRDESFGGSYYREVEYRYTGGAGTHQANNYRAVHIQDSACTDLCGVGSTLQRRCIESDTQSEVYSTAGMISQILTRRFRPFWVRSPREVGIQWHVGIARPRAGQVPVSCIADWTQQIGGRRILVVGAGRSLYEALSLWEPDSPYDEAGPQCVSLHGQEGDHLEIQPTNSTLQLSGSGGARNTIAWDLWIKPRRQKGDQTLVCYGLPGGVTTASVYNYRISLIDGALSVTGTENSGGHTWGFQEGNATAGQNDVRPSLSVRCGRWNHVVVQMSSSGVAVWVNGQSVNMVDRNTLGVGNSKKTDVYGAGTADPPTGQLYIGGTPRGRFSGANVVAALGGPVLFSWASFDGLISTVRCRSTGITTVPPLTRPSATGCLELLQLNAGSGWRLTSQAGFDAQSRARELRVIATDLEESSVSRYTTVAFRDRLLLSNGESRAQRVRYTSEQDALGRLRVEQLGIHAPMAKGTLLAGATGGASGTTVAPGTYSVWMTFLTDDGLESEPSLLGQFNVSALSTTGYTVRIKNMPRSWDPQVTGRRLYVGLGDVVQNRDIPNNDGADHDITLTGQETGIGLTAGERLVAPRGRHIDIAGAYVAIADLTDEPAGQNTIAWSQASEASYWPVNNESPLDTEEGKPILAISRLLGSVYIHKRDQLSQLRPASLDDPTTVLGSLTLNNTSDGCGGGHTPAMNLLYGAGDRAVFKFDGANLNVVSEAIEPTWRNEYDRSDDALKLRTFGAYHKKRSEYWISAVRVGERRATTILVLALSSEVWSKLVVPEHSFLCSVDDAARSSRVPVIGTTSGRLLTYSETVAIDGHDGVDPLEGALALSGTASASTSTSLTIASGAFDTLLGGHGGQDVVLTLQDGTTTTRRIDYNDKLVLYWTTPVTQTIVSYQIGGYDCYWTSPYLKDGQAAREQDLERAVLELEPIAGSVTLDIATVRNSVSLSRAFPATEATFSLSTAVGWIVQQLKPFAGSLGHWHRLRIRTSGASKSWALVGYGIEARANKAIANAGSGS